MTEEQHLGYADDGRAATLFCFPQRPDSRRVLAGDARLAAGGEDVGDLFALRGPAGYGSGGTVFQVIGMRDHSNCAFPVLGHRLHAATFPGTAPSLGPP